MIYAITLSKIIPGSQQGYESGFLEDWTTDAVQAEKIFNNIQLNEEYFRKELWGREAGGRKKMIKSEKYNGT